MLVVVRQASAAAVAAAPRPQPIDRAGEMSRPPRPRTLVHPCLDTFWLRFAYVTPVLVKTYCAQHMCLDTFWLRFTYVTPVLVKTCCAQPIDRAGDGHAAEGGPGGAATTPQPQQPVEAAAAVASCRDASCW
jgi:hypothetical protein